MYDTNELNYETEVSSAIENRVMVAKREAAGVLDWKFELVDGNYSVGNRKTARSYCRHRELYSKSCNNS